MSVYLDENGNEIQGEVYLDDNGNPVPAKPADPKQAFKDELLAKKLAEMNKANVYKPPTDQLSTAGAAKDMNSDKSLESWGASPGADRVQAMLSGIAASSGNIWPAYLRLADKYLPPELGGGGWAEQQRKQVMDAEKNQEEGLKRGGPTSTDYRIGYWGPLAAQAAAAPLAAGLRAGLSGGASKVTGEALAEQAATKAPGFMKSVGQGFGQGALWGSGNAVVNNVADKSANEDYTAQDYYDLAKEAGLGALAGGAVGGTLAGISSKGPAFLNWLKDQAAKQKLRSMGFGKGDMGALSSDLGIRDAMKAEIPLGKRLQELGVGEGMLEGRNTMASQIIAKNDAALAAEAEAAKELSGAAGSQSVYTRPQEAADLTAKLTDEAGGVIPQNARNRKAYGSVLGDIESEADRAGLGLNKKQQEFEGSKMKIVSRNKPVEGQPTGDENYNFDQLHRARIEADKIAYDEAAEGSARASAAKLRADNLRENENLAAASVEASLDSPGPGAKFLNAKDAAHKTFALSQASENLNRASAGGNAARGGIKSYEGLTRLMGLNGMVQNNFSKALNAAGNSSIAAGASEAAGAMSNLPATITPLAQSIEAFVQPQRKKKEEEP